MILRTAQRRELCEHWRMVIVLDPTLKIDEVDLPYKAFVELFKGLIIRQIVEEQHWTITKASNYLHSKFNVHDEYIEKVINTILKVYEPKILANRNPM